MAPRRRSSISFEEPAEQLTAKLQKAHLDMLGRSIAEIERHVEKSARALSHYQQLLTVPGIGKILAMTIVLEAGDIARFPSAEKFASYCRMVKSARMSNGKKKGENNRKCGNRHLAWAFIEAANFIRRYDPQAQAWHDRKAARTHPIIAKKALGCKIAKAVWYILARGSAYESERLFGPAPAGKCGVKPAAEKQSGRASASQRKGLNVKSAD